MRTTPSALPECKKGGMSPILWQKRDLKMKSLKGRKRTRRPIVQERGNVHHFVLGGEKPTREGRAVGKGGKVRS